MFRLIALIISILLQFVAAFAAIRLTKVTKYRLSWIFISFAFLIMAFRRSICLIQFTNKEISEQLNMLHDWLGILISFLLTGGVILIGEIFYALKKAEIERKRAEKKVLNAIILTEEKEKKRFAKDLHDGLGPLLSTVKMSVSALNQMIKNKNEKEIITNTDKVINEAITSIKEISNNLSPHILNNFGLVSAINSFITKINSTGTINISINTNLSKDRFDQNIEVILYRALCELINNTVKHADAKNVNITLSKNENILTLNYIDDGKGFNIQDLKKEQFSGMGYSNISTRIKSINGKLTLESSKGKGFFAGIKINLK
ncbi:MAG: ATP-binding protein [Bacteroidales bacterium]|nr:ATP-binding protein [Bacteroidales bacterium]